jgi:hypothetical protein
MAWSDFDHPLTENMLQERQNDGINDQFDELKFRYRECEKEIHEYVRSEYPDPSKAPDFPPSVLAGIVGRDLRKNIPKIREFYTHFKGTDNISKKDRDMTLEWVAIRALINGDN